VHSAKVISVSNNAFAFGKEFNLFSGTDCSTDRKLNTFVRIHVTSYIIKTLDIGIRLEKAYEYAERPRCVGISVKKTAVVKRRMFGICLNRKLGTGKEAGLYMR